MFVWREEEGRVVEQTVVTLPATPGNIFPGLNLQTRSQIYFQISSIKISKVWKSTTIRYLFFIVKNAEINPALNIIPTCLATSGKKINWRLHYSWPSHRNIWSTGYFKKVYRSLRVRVPLNILKYLSIQKLPQKRSHQKIFTLFFDFITNINICIYILKYNIFEYNFECI